MKWGQFCIILACMFFMWKVNIDLECSRDQDQRLLLKEILFQTKKLYVETVVNRLEHRNISEDPKRNEKEEFALRDFKWKAQDNFWKWNDE